MTAAASWANALSPEGADIAHRTRAWIRGLVASGTPVDVAGGSVLAAAIYLAWEAQRDGELMANILRGLAAAIDTHAEIEPDGWERFWEEVSAARHSEQGGAEA